MDDLVNMSEDHGYFLPKQTGMSNFGNCGVEPVDVPIEELINALNILSNNQKERLKIMSLGH